MKVYGRRSARLTIHMEEAPRGKSIIDNLSRTAAPLGYLF